MEGMLWEIAGISHRSDITIARSETVLILIHRNLIENVLCAMYKWIMIEETDFSFFFQSYN